MRRFLLALVILAALGRAAWYYEIYRPRRSATASPQEMIIPQGSSVQAIGERLRALGLVRYPWIFRALVVVRGDALHLKAGDYSLEGPLSLDQIAEQLVQGQIVRREVTIPEGKSREEIAALFAGHGVDVPAFLARSADPALIHDLDPDAPDLEGYLFPDTYDVPVGKDAAADIVRRMVQRFREVMTPLLPLVAESGHSLRQVVTLASIVELETARADERPRIASVFLNRLQRGMLLQTDPTVIYALRHRAAYDGNIHKQDLGVDSPYNTYRHPGLPPGPIASPGRESLLAILHPAGGRELYFVSRNDGTHQFSQTLAEHERAVDHFQRHRGGGR